MINYVSCLCLDGYVTINHSSQYGSKTYYTTLVALCNFAPCVVPAGPARERRGFVETVDALQGNTSLWTLVHRLSIEMYSKIRLILAYISDNIRPRPKGVPNCGTIDRYPAYLFTLLNNLETDENEAISKRPKDIVSTNKWVGPEEIGHSGMRR